MGRDLTGKYLDEALRDLLPADALQSCLNVYTEAMRWKQPAQDTVQLRPDGREGTILHRLVLPCAADGGSVDSFVVAIFAEKVSVRDPRLPLRDP